MFQLVIHVGVSTKTRVLKLEVCAHGHDYWSPDCDGICPPNATSFCCEKDEDKIQCGLNIPNIVQEYNKLENSIRATESDNAGR